MSGGWRWARAGIGVGSVGWTTVVSRASSRVERPLDSFYVRCRASLVFSCDLSKDEDLLKIENRK
jgi:hypothetical protein